MHLVEVFEIDAIVKLSKFEDDLDRFGLVIPREAPMAFAVEDTFAALKYKVGTDWVL